MYSMLLMVAASTGGEAPAFHGRILHHSCHGCCGGWVAPAGCCGGGCAGGYTWGPGHGAYRPASSACYGGCWGGCCGGGCWGSGYAYGPAVTFTYAGPASLNPPDASEKSALKVELPSIAKLYVDGKEVPGFGTLRTFATPALPRGQDYYYDLKAEITVDGKPVVEEKRVIVRAGGTTSESFARLIASAQAAGEKVTSK